MGRLPKNIIMMQKIWQSLLLSNNFLDAMNMPEGNPGEPCFTAMNHLSSWTNLCSHTVFDSGRFFFLFKEKKEKL